MTKLLHYLRRYFPAGAEHEIWAELRPDLVQILGTESQKVYFSFPYGILLDQHSLNHYHVLHTRAKIIDNLVSAAVGIVS